MANHYSALKRARQTETRTTRNRAARSRVRTALRSLRESLGGKDAKASTVQFSSAVAELDKAVLIDRSAKLGVIKKNTAARYKSKLHVRIKSLAT